MSPSPPVFSLLIVGDEILSGKRQDQHFAFALKALGQRGLGLASVRYVGDDRDLITRCLRDSRALSARLFCFGGIGATPDDHTRQAAAAAFDLPLQPHPEAQALIRQRMAQLPPASPEEHARRLEMGVLPQGAGIVPNSFNQIPGFSLEEHYFFPGFPVMAHPMLEWVLETVYRHQFNRYLNLEKGFIAYELAESRVSPLLEAIEADFPGVKTFSLPSVGNKELRRHIELGVKAVVLREGGGRGAFDQAFMRLYEEVVALGVETEDGGGDLS